MMIYQFKNRTSENLEHDKKNLIPLTLAITFIEQFWKDDLRSTIVH